jgi:hypothetical protein
MLFTCLGIASALIFMAGDTPYLLDTYRARTRPHRITWGIFTLMNIIGFANQYASGARNSLWLFGAGALMTGLIFLGSIRNGEGGRSKFDMICLVVGLLGVILWLLFKSPLYSVFANVIANLAAMWPTYKKAAKHPATETRIAWLVGANSTLLGAVAVGKLDWRLLVLPITSAAMQGYMVYLLYWHTSAPLKRSSSVAEATRFSEKTAITRADFAGSSLRIGALLR